MNLAIEGEQQSHGMLGDGIGRISRNADDGESLFFRRGQIDIIKASAAKGDEFYADLLQPEMQAASTLSFTKTQTNRSLWRVRRFGC